MPDTKYILDLSTDNCIVFKGCIRIDSYIADRIKVREHYMDDDLAASGSKSTTPIVYFISFADMRNFR